MRLIISFGYMEVHFTTHHKAIGRAGDEKVDVNFKVVRKDIEYSILPLLVYMCH